MCKRGGGGLTLRMGLEEGQGVEWSVVEGETERGGRGFGGTEKLRVKVVVAGKLRPNPSVSRVSLSDVWFAAVEGDRRAGASEFQLRD